MKFPTQLYGDYKNPKNPWDVGLGCQVAIFFEALKRGVMNGGSGVSIGGGDGFLGLGKNNMFTSTST